jgi:soluble P-type ATPase
MIKIEIPGRDLLELENIVFDFNGTIAVGGRILENIKEKINALSNLVNIYVITADTYGQAKGECEGLNLNVITIPTGCAGVHKMELVKKLGKEKTVAIGNGFNDIEMFKEAILSVAVIEGEGACSKLILNSDIVTRSIDEALDLFLNTDRIKADLRW